MKVTRQFTGNDYGAFLMRLIKQPEEMISHLQEENNFFIHFPECEKMSGLIGRGVWHEEDVWEHTLKVYQIASGLTNDPEVLLSCLLHDYGKPASFIPDTRKFSGHEDVGATMVAPCLSDLFPDNMERNMKVYWLVKNHMWDRDGNKTDKKKKWWAFFKTMQLHGVTLEHYTILRFADFMGRKQSGEWVLNKELKSFGTFYKEDSTRDWWMKYLKYMEGGLHDGRN